MFFLNLSFHHFFVFLKITSNSFPFKFTLDDTDDTDIDIAASFG